MFKADRVFSVQNPINASNEWFFQAREGNIGPYGSKNQAELMLKNFIKSCVETEHTGGRGQDTRESSLQFQSRSFFNYAISGTIPWY